MPNLTLLIMQQLMLNLSTNEVKNYIRKKKENRMQMSFKEEYIHQKNVYL